MTVFDVFVNGRKICRAGVGSDGVLNAIVSWVKLTGPGAANARKLKQPLQEMRLHVGGLAGDTHRRWAAPRLKHGDRVSVAVVGAKTFDPPTSTTTRDQQEDERRERRSAGPHVFEETTLLNVDLDIWSRTRLEPLVAAFGRKVLVLHVGPEKRRHSAHLELAASGVRPNADRIIQRLVALVKALPASRRAEWNSATAREFNVGIQAATRPHDYLLRLDQRTLEAATSVNARIGVTVYGAEEKT